MSKSRASRQARQQPLSKTQSAVSTVELASAPNKVFKETIVFVHHFGGSKRSVLRHVKFVNDLGFDAIRFTLTFNSALPNRELPITADAKFGFRHMWTDEIEAVLNSVHGPKIVYSFSMPSNSALEAISRRGASDISAWICDGGPFAELPRCTWNLYSHEYTVKSKVLRTAMTAYSLFLYGFGFESSLATTFARLPKNFPTLSIRGWDDPLVPPSAIDRVFSYQENLKLQRLALPSGRHLDGLKRFPDEYKSRVREFLNSVTEPISRSR